ncbi:MAG: hypothetical protein WD689_11140 [Gaiellaceae bacterium]
MNRWGAGSWGDKVAAWSGVIFAVLAALGFIVLGQPDADATGDEIVQYFADNDSAMQWQALLFGLAAVFYLWFGGTIASAVRRAEGDPAGRVPAIIVVTAAASAAIYLAGEAAWVALARPTEAGVSSSLYDLGGNAFVMSGFIAAAFAWAVTLGVMRTGLLADWVGWLGTATMALLVASSVITLFAELDSSFSQVLGSIAFFVFLAWVGITSLVYSMGMRSSTM